MLLISIMRSARKYNRFIEDNTIAIITFALFFILMFWETLFYGKFLIIGDSLVQFYPLRLTAWEMIRQGTLPLWTPLIFSGCPLLAQIQLAIAYPLTWGYFFLPGHVGEQIYILAPYLLSPVFTFIFLRQIGISNLSSILGGLVYGYSGFMASPIGLLGSHSNSALWLPLVLVGVARSQNKAFLPSLLISTFAYSLSILGGATQMSAYIGYLAFMYGIFLAIFPKECQKSQSENHLTLRRWRPLFIVIGSTLLTIGLTAFQTLETLAWTKASIRKNYTYELASSGSYKLDYAIRSLLQPISSYTDSSTYVPFIALLFLAITVRHSLLRSSYRLHIIFWIFIAVLSWLLILGSNTFLYPLYFKLPLLSQFRYPSRHTMEWTFAIAVLASFGLEITSTKIANIREKLLAKQLLNTYLFVAGGCVILIASGITLYCWIESVGRMNYPITDLQPSFLAWKIGFNILIIIALILFGLILPPRLQMILSIIAVATACYIEPYISLVKPFTSLNTTSKRFETLGDSSIFLRDRMKGQERNFTAMNPFAVSNLPNRSTDSINGNILAQIRDVNGYQALMPRKYSQALHTLPWGSVKPDNVILPDPALLESKSHLLDLLNVRYVTSYTHLSSVNVTPETKEGIHFDANNLVLNHERDNAYSLDAGSTKADTLVLVSILSNAVDIENETPVAEITIQTSNEKTIKKYLRAGIDTTDWAYDHPIIKKSIKHSLAPIYDSAPGNSEGHFRAYRFYTKINLGESVQVERVYIKSLINSENVKFHSYKASLYDSVTKLSTPLPQPSPKHWRQIYDKSGVTILENLNQLPHTWLTTDVKFAYDEEILARIRGESIFKYVPFKTALVNITQISNQYVTLPFAPEFRTTFVDITSDKMPKLSGKPLSADSYSRIITYEPNRIVIEANSDQQAILVVSEMYYPGWVAKIDGRQAPIYKTDFLLRGIFVPSGKHTIEMKYGAPGARNGAIVSLLTIISTISFVIYNKRRKKRRDKKICETITNC